MNVPRAPDLDGAIDRLIAVLVERRTAIDHWDGHLASSALSTGTAILALHLSLKHGYARSLSDLRAAVDAGVAWLTDHQNDDGGWGDSVRSRTNISTTAIVWAALAAIAPNELKARAAVERAGRWLHHAAGSSSPGALRSAILRRYGKDQTFSVPILTVLALAGALDADPVKAWRSVPQLPFELAAVPHRWFQHLRLPVVSYALPALIGMGQVRHAHAPSRNLVARVIRQQLRRRTHAVLREMQPESGGYLEATPLTSFVVMSLAGMQRADSPVVEHGVRFLLDSKRRDGSWPIDTNLSTWVTTLSIGALAAAGVLGDQDRSAMRRWLLAQQSAREHPFTHAAAGAWAWTPLSGGVPDADDTAGALLALMELGEPTRDVVAAGAAGVQWLLRLQNRDGGIPTFCRGWGTLPFDRSTPEITAHTLRAWSAWVRYLEPALQREVWRAATRAVNFLASHQRTDGAWIPLWFGNEHAPGEDNPVYGTARTIVGLSVPFVSNDKRAATCAAGAVGFLLRAQNDDGGWGGSAHVASSLEETGVALSALSVMCSAGNDTRLRDAIARGATWLARRVLDGRLDAAPVGLYFARLWYFEELYPLVFALHGLASVRKIAAR